MVVYDSSTPSIRNTEPLVQPAKGKVQDLVFHHDDHDVYAATVDSPTSGRPHRLFFDDNASQYLIFSGHVKYRAMILLAAMVIHILLELFADEISITNLATGIEMVTYCYCGCVIFIGVIPLFFALLLKRACLVIPPMFIVSLWILFWIASLCAFVSFSIASVVDHFHASVCVDSILEIRDNIFRVLPIDYHPLYLVVGVIGSILLLVTCVVYLVVLIRLRRYYKTRRTYLSLNM